MSRQPTPEQIQQHYRIERELADRIRSAPRDRRAAVTLQAYDELFRRVPWHVGHLGSAESRAIDDASYAIFLRLAGSGHDILEIGCGGSNHLRQLAPRNRRCVGIDISAEVLGREADLPPNVELRIADAVDLSLFADESFDFVFSKQLIEHIHPDDIRAHLGEVRRVLRTGGRYAFETPSAITGPHDVSRHFDAEPTGFHLQEYSFRTILPLLRAAGFGRVSSPLFRERAVRNSPLLARMCEVPATWKLPGESIAARLPRGRARQLASSLFRLNLMLIAGR